MNKTKTRRPLSAKRTTFTKFSTEVKSRVRTPIDDHRPVIGNDFRFLKENFRNSKSDILINITLVFKECENVN